MAFLGSLAAQIGLAARRSLPLGTIRGWGKYTVDRMPAPPGTLVFPGDVVSTASESGAQLTLLSGGVAQLEPNSEVTLTQSMGDLDLARGALTLRIAGGRPSRAIIHDTHIVLRAVSPSVCRLEVARTSAIIAALQGQVTVEGAGPLTVIPAGRVALLGRPSSQQPVLAANGGSQKPTAARVASMERTSSVGRVVASYPDEVVKHPQDEIAAPLRLGELIEVGDSLGTLGAGKVRIQFFDNSLLDLGIATELRVERYDAGTRTTELSLSAGHLRAEVSAAQGSPTRLVIRAPFLQVTAGATMIFVSADARMNIVCNAGSVPVTVQARESAAGRVATVHAGECSVTRAGEAPGTPIADPARIEREMVLASYEAGPGVPQGALRPLLKRSRTGADAGVAILSLVTFVELQSAFNNLRHAGSDAQPYLNDLQTVANDFAAEGATLQQLNQLEYNLCEGFINFFADRTFASPSSPPPTCP